MAGDSSVLVPKGPRAAESAAPEPDIEQIRRDLFALPVPPQPSGRPFSTRLALGRIMRLRGLTVNDVAKIDGAPNTRTISAVLCGHKLLTPEQKSALAAGLSIDRRLL